MAGLSLQVLQGVYGVARLPPGQTLPDWALQGSFCSVTRTLDELSIVCSDRDVPTGVVCERGWRCLKVLGPLDFSLVGILARLSTVLADHGISLFALSTFDTDYLLVKAEVLDATVTALTADGHSVEQSM